MENTTNKKINIRPISGIVVSSRNHTTIVSVERLVKHPKYGKYIEYRKKFKADDKADLREVGTKVEIVPCRPISREKRFRVI